MPGVVGVLVLALVVTSAVATRQMANPPNLYRNAQSKIIIDEAAQQCFARQVIVDTRHPPSEGGIPEEKVYELIGDPGSSLAWVSLEETGFGTLDGRVHDPILGAPGGDFGVFLSAMALMERERLGQAFGDKEVLDYLTGYLSWTAKGRFTYHTDAEIIRNATSELRITNKAIREASRFDIENPDATLQPQFIDFFAQPEFQGDLHLKHVMSDPSPYNIRLGLVQSLVRAFFTLHWGTDDTLREKTALVQLEGAHEEQGFVTVYEPNQCLALRLAHPYPPNVDGVGSVFLYSADATNFLRRELAEYFKIHNKKSNPWRDAFFAKLVNFSHSIVEQTLEDMVRAKGLPVYNVYVR